MFFVAYDVSHISDRHHRLRFSPKAKELHLDLVGTLSTELIYYLYGRS